MRGPMLGCVGRIMLNEARAGMPPVDLASEFDTDYLYVPPKQTVDAILGSDKQLSTLENVFVPQNGLVYIRSIDAVTRASVGVEAELVSAPTRLGASLLPESIPGLVLLEVTGTPGATGYVSIILRPDTPSVIPDRLEVEYKLKVGIRIGPAS